VFVRVFCGSSLLNHSGLLVQHPREVDPHVYKALSLVERFFNCIKQFRRIATRSNKLDACYLAFVTSTSVLITPGKDSELLSGMTRSLS